jgi:hypothetical protein
MSDTPTQQQLEFAKIAKLIIKDLQEITTSNNSLSKFTSEQVARYLQQPIRYEKELRQLSNYLYNASPNYKRLILYFSCLLTFDYVIEPYDINYEKVDIDKFKKQYFKIGQIVENMNISHEMLKVLRIAFKEDVFFGYEHQTKDSYFIQKLNPDYCQISSIEDGVYNFAFDFSFFDKQSNKHKLNTYPEEFRELHAKYKSTKEKWQELSSENTICIKINEEVEYPIPPFNVVFESIFDLDEYKKLKKVKTKMDNYMILTQRIPIDEKTGDPNKFLIDLDTAIQFHNKASESLPDSVGLVTSPMEIQGIKLDRKLNDKDSVSEAERDYFNSAGVSQLLFNSDKATNSGLSKSVQTDEQILFAVLRQIERWLNRKVKNYLTQYKFKVRFLNTTVFNVDDVFEKYLKAAQFGMPVKNALAASVGLTPSSMSSMAFLENDVLNLSATLQPLASSHTQSGKDGTGAPSKKDGDLSESGEKTKENDGNVRD